MSTKAKNLILMAYVCLCFLSCLCLIPTLKFGGGDSVILQATRLEHIKPFLPKTRYLGYLSDSELILKKRGVLYTGKQDDFDYVLAYYVLVPYILKEEPVGRWILGYFVDPGQGQVLIKQYHLKMVRDYGYGYMLLQPEGVR